MQKNLRLSIIANSQSLRKSIKVMDGAEWKLVACNSFWIGFIVGLSSEVVYGVMGDKETTTLVIFVLYL